MRLKMFFLQILIVLPLTTFGERLGYTEELVRDLYTVIKKSGTIGDLINNLPLDDSERKRNWEFIEKYGTENLAIVESTLKSRQIIWRLESGHRIVQDFSRLSVGEVSFNGKPVSIKGRTLEELNNEIRNFLGNEFASYPEKVDLNLFDSGDPFVSVEYLAEVVISWLMPVAQCQSYQNYQKGGEWATSAVSGAFGTFAQRRQQRMNADFYAKTTGVSPDACYAPPCFTQTGPLAWARNYGSPVFGGGLRSASYLWGDFGRENAGTANLFAATTAAALPGARKTRLIPNDETVVFNLPATPEGGQQRVAFATLKN